MRFMNNDDPNMHIIMEWRVTKKPKFLQFVYCEV